MGRRGAKMNVGSIDVQGISYLAIQTGVQYDYDTLPQNKTGTHGHRGKGQFECMCRAIPKAKRPSHASRAECKQNSKERKRATNYLHNRKGERVHRCACVRGVSHTDIMQHNVQCAVADGRSYLFQCIDFLRDCQRSF